MKDVISSTLISLSKVHFGFKPIEERNSLIFLSKGLRKKPFYANIEEEGDSIIVRFYNVFPSCVKKQIETIGEFFGDEWIGIKINLDRNEAIESIRSKFDEVFYLSKMLMKEVVDSSKEASLYYYGGYKVSLLGFSFFKVPKRYKEGLLTNFWAPYPIVTLANKEGNFYFWNDVVNINEPLLKIDEEKFVFFMGEKEPKTIDLNIIINALKEMNFEITEERPYDIFKEDVIRKLSRMSSEKAESIRKLIKLFKKQDASLIMKFIAKLIANKKVGDFFLTGNVIKKFEKVTRKYRGAKTITLREDELGIEFDKEIKGKILDVNGRRYIIIEVQ